MRPKRDERRSVTTKDFIVQPDAIATEKSGTGRGLRGAVLKSSLSKETEAELQEALHGSTVPVGA